MLVIRLSTILHNPSRFPKPGCDACVILIQTPEVGNVGFRRAPSVFGWLTIFI
jgi:hypothetical protein